MKLKIIKTGILIASSSNAFFLVRMPKFHNGQKNKAVYPKKMADSAAMRILPGNATQPKIQKRYTQNIKSPMISNVKPGVPLTLPFNTR